MKIGFCSVRALFLVKDWDCIQNSRNYQAKFRIFIACVNSTTYWISLEIEPHYPVPPYPHLILLGGSACWQSKSSFSIILYLKVCRSSTTTRLLQLCSCCLLLFCSFVQQALLSTNAGSSYSKLDKFKLEKSSLEYFSPRKF